MIVYVDTSAALKRVLREPESAALTDLFAQHHAAGTLLTASSLVWLEAWRTFRRARLPRVAELVERALSGVAEYELDSALLSPARLVGPAGLRSLDAIHLASAVAVGSDGVLTYDDLFAAAADAAGLSVLAPT